MVLRLVSIVLIGLLSTGSIYNSNRKKIDKTIAKIWPDIEVHIESQDPVEGLGGEYFKVFASDSLLAHLILDEAPGKVDNFSYMVLFDLDGLIRNVNVLQYRENYGGEIASKRFLRQYIGKANGISMEYLKDIDGISGATISVRAINHGVKKNSKELFQLLNSE